MIQDIIVYGIVLTTLGYIGYSLQKSLRPNPKKTGCDGCRGCELKKTIQTTPTYLGLQWDYPQQKRGTIIK